VRTSGLLALLALAALVGLALLSQGGGAPGEANEPTPNSAGDGVDLSVPPVLGDASTADRPGDLEGAFESLPSRVAAARRVPRGTHALLRVEVFDPWDRPARDVEVVATRLDGAGVRRILRMQTGPSGFLYLRAGVDYRLEAVPTSRWYERQVAVPVRIEDRRVRFDLATKAVRASGVVRRIGAEGSQPGVLLSARLLEDGTTSEGTWSPDGSFDLLLPAGTVLLDAWSPGWVGRYAVSGRAGDWTRDLTIFLRPSPGGPEIGHVPSRPAKTKRTRWVDNASRHLRTARLRFRAHRQEGAPSETGMMVLLQNAAPTENGWSVVESGLVRSESGTFVVAPVGAGSYRLLFYDAGWGGEAEFTTEAGEIVEVELPLDRADT
jgi:hypothetical protein